MIDLSLFSQLRKLETLDCSKCRVERAPPELWDMPSLREVILYEAVLPGVPKEVLSEFGYDVCLERLRAHFRDLKGGGNEISEFKFMLLGNGRVGKTQICRRLQGQEYDETVPSTHGVKIGAAPLTALRDPATLRIWDFGGQDIYHGTHALFLKSRAIFMLVWTPESEALHEHDYGGLTFRNQPLGYWLDYVREFGGEDSPVIVVQTQCDLPEQERLRPPVDDKALDAFPFKKVLHYSAKENRGRAALDEALAEAVQWLRRKQGVAVIGTGRAAVKARLEKMYAKGKQLISQDEFLALCKKAGNVSSPPLLLDYLHNIGAVFYREGLFGDAIILDQAWALDAVYAVFHRESKAFKTIERYSGRFRRSDLAEWVWQEHSEKEQELFLSFMEQCGICFPYRRGEKDVEAEYIAPDLLPASDDPAIQEELRQKWDDRCDAEATLTYDLLPPGLMRSLISRIGEQAGLAAEYWRDGFYFYDRETGARALVEQRYTKDWAGEIHIQTQRGQAQALLERLLQFIDDRHVAIGARLSGTAARIVSQSSPRREEAIRTDEGSGNHARARTFNQNRILRLLCLERRHAGRPRAGSIRGSALRSRGEEGHKNHPRQDCDALWRPHLQIHEPHRARRSHFHRAQRQISEICLLHERTVRHLAQLQRRRRRVHRPARAFSSCRAQRSRRLGPRPICHLLA